MYINDLDNLLAKDLTSQIVWGDYGSNRSHLIQQGNLVQFQLANGVAMPIGGKVLCTLPVVPIQPFWVQVMDGANGNPNGFAFVDVHGTVTMTLETSQNYARIFGVFVCR